MTTDTLLPASFYITTAIPYVNARPHLGFALELVQADVLARYHRQKGRDVRFQTGTDDNSLKNVRAAQAASVDIASFVAENGDGFEALCRKLDISHDDFLRTGSDPRHAPGVAALWSACKAHGDIYPGRYEGLYCVGCEQYLRHSDLVDGLCPEHLAPPERLAEDNAFFRLSRYQDKLRDLVSSGALAIEPAHYRQEVLRFIEAGLEDFSISRSRQHANNWGVPVPDDPDQVIYVWFDALGNYLTALEHHRKSKEYDRYWQNGEVTHLIGKGITRFHAIYWPAILLSAGLPLPSKILVHGYLTVEGQKIGKSLGNAIDPSVWIERYGCDPLRHFLLHHVRSTCDGDVSEDRLRAAYDGELADKLGNLLQRTLALVDRYCERSVPSPSRASAAEEELIALAQTTSVKVNLAVEAFQLQDATAAIWSLVDGANRYLQEQAPWKLAKDSTPTGRERLGTVLNASLECLRIVAVHLVPFLPKTASRLARRLGCDVDRCSADWGGLVPGARVYTGPPLFPKDASSAASSRNGRASVADA